MSPAQPFTENNLRHLFTKAGDEFILLETARTTTEDHHSYLFTQAEKQLRHYSGDNPATFLAQCEQCIAKGSYLAGWFSYEFGYALEDTLSHLAPQQPGILLADLGVYPSCQIFNHEAQIELPETIIPPEDSCNITNITFSQSQQQYIDHIHRIKEYILAGDTYQVNYTLKLFFDFLGARDSLYLQLRRNQQVSFAAYIKQKDSTIMSFSPELFFRKQNNTITVRPMKGTIPRGCTEAEDHENALFLQTDLKNRAENIMIVDLLRNDLGRIARKGQVNPLSLFDVETYNSLLQMTSTIQAKVIPDLDLSQLFKSLFPCGSVTGAPKIRTMEIIKELETDQRGVYTGAIGFIDPDGNSTFNVPIRTVHLNKNRGTMGIGAGIVADSDPEQEWQECLLKGKFLTDSQQPFKLIETILWQPESGYQFRAEHGTRLQRSAHYFNFIFPAESYDCALDTIAETLHETSRIRVTLNQEGTITSQAASCQTPCQFDPTPLPTQPEARVCFAAQAVSSKNPFLYHKTTNRELYNSTWAKAREAQYIDALFLNEKDEITEGCISTIFVYKDNILLTPPLTSGLLPGVFRQYLLDHFPEQIREQVLYKDDLLAENAIVCIGNSVRGLIPVQISPNMRL